MGKIVIEVCRKGCAKAWLFLRKCDKKWKQKCDKKRQKFVTSLAKKFRGGYNKKNFKDRNGLYI